MEAWQKKLNEILRLNNGFANAGAIPKDVHAMGERAVDAYMNARAADKPSDAQWVYEQALLQSHSYFVSAMQARDALHNGKQIGPIHGEMDWSQFCVLWQRYLTAATWFVWGLARARVRQQRAAGGGYYAYLRDEHRAYYKPVKYTSDDLSEDEKRRQVNTHQPHLARMPA